MTFLYDCDAERGAEWAAIFAKRAPEIAFHYRADAIDPRSVKYLGVWNQPINLSAKSRSIEALRLRATGPRQANL
ncbi:MAG: hypothetical protein E5V72_12465 [Mesorhizobium sp.]|uniref:hypothetical protein n=1 Tax=unclassified Mesorhizobium TaxID=325217 RepID=UPI000FD4399D|nr:MULTISPECIES: hypothetical protein [unclassified Mesorhizobium]RUV91001.1 hypothetical protein EOA88_11500 [Mesorhizobium sp. M5C.F.Ca.IN.020.14.1.1]RUV30807.1 hypothetical protein EOA86_09470 [Mesorhizobium sp. M5C.F.Ca.IN.020.32.2.1]RWC36935.1 MAG: hypothetical protein EOS70_01035 [Mesorhizobium sp.]RWC43980.1 MAG: hypothetical protein EOS28_12555 [Mesorhizobium sp.]RWE55274.1 MAG: hypothetical protein EOS67_19805 [Mesorhizobium sp.]